MTSYSDVKYSLKSEFLGKHENFPMTINVLCTFDEKEKYNTSENWREPSRYDISNPKKVARQGAYLGFK